MRQDGKLTLERVRRLATGATVWDRGGVPGFGARRQSGSDVSFFLKYRFAGKQRRYTIGKLGALTVEKARQAATTAWGKVANNIDPAAQRQADRAQARATVETAFKVVAVDFVKRYAKPNNRSWRETERILNRYVVPEWSSRPIAEIRRSDVTVMLDKIADTSGPVMADHVLAAVRKLFNWQAARDDDFRSPIVRGMARTKPRDRARKRVLSDAELRALWTAAGSASPPVFGSLVRFLILTAQRRDEAARARWKEIEGDLWTVPAERYKTGNPNAVPLTDAARGVLDTLARIGPFAFTTTGKTPFSGFSKSKAALEEVMLAELHKTDPKAKPERWTLHDLRRTARSLMSRAGVSADHAERVLGHVIPGVRGVYDRHAFVNEKREALAKLATLVERIINPLGDNVVPLARKAG